MYNVYYFMLPCFHYDKNSLSLPCLAIVNTYYSLFSVSVILSFIITFFAYLQIRADIRSIVTESIRDLEKKLKSDMRAAVQDLGSRRNITDGTGKLKISFAYFILEIVVKNFFFGIFLVDIIFLIIIFCCLKLSLQTYFDIINGRL